MRSFVAVFLGVVILTATISLDSHASTIRDDRTWDDYAPLADACASSVGRIYEYTSSGTYIGSGTVISSEVDTGTWVLTAAHVVQDATSLTFNLQGTTYSADSWDYYSYMTDDNLLTEGVGDIGLFHINTYIAGATATKLYIDYTDDLIGSVATYAGYGCIGYGDTGYTPYSYGTLHAVQNTFDMTIADGWGTYYSDSVLLCDFDAPGSSSILDLEGLIAPGDSGGGVFATIGGETYLTGVNSFILYFDGTSNSDYGDLAGCVSVCDYLDWIVDTTELASLLPTPGDANRDGTVDSSDLGLLADHWLYGVGEASPDAVWAMGDFNRDRAVDSSDLGLLASHWQEGVFDMTMLTMSGIIVVPEPGVGWLLLGLLMVMLRHPFVKKLFAP